MHRDKKETLTHQKLSIMITLKNIDERGLAYIVMAISDIVNGEFVSADKGRGMNLSHTWLTPETCYWLKKLSEETNPLFTSRKTLARLQAGTNIGLE